MPPHPAGSPTLDPFSLRDEVAKQFPGATVDYVPLGLRPDEPAAFGLAYPETNDEALAVPP